MMSERGKNVEGEKVRRITNREGNDRERAERRNEVIKGKEARDSQKEKKGQRKKLQREDNTMRYGEN